MVAEPEDVEMVDAEEASAESESSEILCAISVADVRHRTIAQHTRSPTHRTQPASPTTATYRVQDV